MTPRSDEQIHRDVLRELENDEHVMQTEVGVQVSDGVVTLTGIVSSLSKKLAACAAAHRTESVRCVANNLQVRNIGNYGISDTEIAIAVRNALDSLLAENDYEVHVTVAHGMVSVYGTIPVARQHAIVIDTIRSVEGALEVVDMITADDANPAATQGPIRESGSGSRHPHRAAQA